MVVVNYIIGHKAIFAAFGVALIDFLWAINPNLKANGLIHSIFLSIGGKDV